MSKKLIVLLLSVTSLSAFASSISVEDKYCSQYANEVITNIGDKHIQEISIEYTLDKTDLANQCKSSIQALNNSLDIKMTAIPGSNELPTVKYKY